MTDLFGPEGTGPIHYGRSFGTGRWLEDDCPCPKAPCGLVVGEPSNECDQHPLVYFKTIRQTHRESNCPGHRPEVESPDRALPHE